MGHVPLARTYRKNAGRKSKKADKQCESGRMWKPKEDMTDIP